MTTFVRVLLGRLIGTAVAGLATWLMIHYGIVLDQDTQQKVTESAVVILMIVFSVIYGITHKLVNKKLNPGDTASATLAQLDADKRERLP